MCAWLNTERDKSPEDADYIEGLLRMPVQAKGHKHIAQVLATDGVDITPDQIRRHRERHQK
jgi:hypothetical protein